MSRGEFSARDTFRVLRARACFQTIFPNIFPSRRPRDSSGSITVVGRRDVRERRNPRFPFSRVYPQYKIEDRPVSWRETKNKKREFSTRN